MLQPAQSMRPKSTIEIHSPWYKQEPSLDDFLKKPFQWPRNMFNWIIVATPHRP